MFKLSIAFITFTMFTSFANAANYEESTQGDLSNNGLTPTSLLLTYGNVVGANGLFGNNIISGTTGRVAGVVDRDYINVTVPVGYVWSALLLGNQTSVGGSGSFLGLAAGDKIAINPVTASSASGLLGYSIYGTASRGTDLLPAMSVIGNGSSGFNAPLAAGDYTLWIQELATGTFNYRFNLVLNPVPESDTYAMLLAGLGIMGVVARRRTQK